MVAHGRDTGLGEQSAEAAAHRGAMQGFAGLACEDQIPPTRRRDTRGRLAVAR